MNTSTETKHTPTPWRVVSGTLIKDELMPFDRDERDTSLIASTGGQAASDKAQANAAFIVRACNSHEQLMALTRRAQAILAAYLPPDGNSDHETLNALLELFDGPESRAALAAAGVKP